MLNFFKYFILILISSATFAQEKMVLIDKTSIDATEIWNFALEKYSYSGNLKVQIGKNEDSGTLLLQIETSNSNFYIGGTVYLFLEDGNVITCTDKDKRTASDKIVQSYYILTASEINLLKNNKITDVRFRIIGTESQFSSPTGFFKAQNKIINFSAKDLNYDTTTSITKLFKK